MDPRGSIYTKNNKINKYDKWNAYMHWEFIFITSSRSKQKLNVTRGLETQRITLSARVIFSKADNRHKCSAMAYFFTISSSSLATQAVHFISISTTHWFENFKQLLARSGWHRWNVAFIHCQSASVRTKTSGRCMVVRSLQKWYTVKYLLTKK